MDEKKLAESLMRIAGELEALAGGAEEQGSLSDGPESVHDFFDTSTVKNQVAK